MAPLLDPEISLRLKSHKRNRHLRLIDMLISVILYGKKEQPVLIDTYSTLNFYYALLVGVLCRCLRIKYCCVLHGGNLPFRLKQNQHLSKLLFTASIANISPSAYLKEEFVKAGYQSCQVPNFIILENYPFLLRSKVRPRLLWVRAFDETYNPQMAIRVLQQVANVYPETQLCMVGPDKDGSRIICESLASELGLLDSVYFTGQLSKNQWIGLSSNYDVFINTTNFDNTPVSVIEAMALGIPVISTRVGGIPFLIDDNVDGLLVPPDNVDAFTKQILHLLNDVKLAERLSLEGRKKAELFSWKNVKPLWINVLNI